MSEKFFTVTSPQRDLEQVPVTVTIKNLEKPGDADWAFEDISNGVIMPLQSETGWWSGTAWMRFIMPSIKKGETKRLRLTKIDKQEKSALITQLDDNALELSLNGKMITRFHYGDRWVRPFLWPLVGADGAELTRSWPMEEREGEDTDHEHHKSVWHAHGDINGIDNWTEWKSHGYSKLESFCEKTSGPVFCRFSTRQDWTDHNKIRVLRCYTDCTLYNLPDDHRILDFTICFRAPDGPVKFGDTKEGGLISVRVTGSMNGSRGGLIENAYGAKGEEECWGKPAPWVDYSGPVNGQIHGISLFDHPENMLYPTRWHVRDYGLFTANPFALHDYLGDDTVDGGKVLGDGVVWKFQYRLYCHKGGAQEGNVRDKFLAWAHPLKVELADD